MTSSLRGYCEKQYTKWYSTQISEPNSLDLNPFHLTAMGLEQVLNPSGLQFPYL